MPRKEQPTDDGGLHVALAQLHESDVDIREAGLDRVRDLARAGLSTDQVALVLDAIGAEFPPSKYAFQSYGEALMQVMWHNIADEHVRLLATRYAQLPDTTRAAALAALAHLGTETATTVYVELLSSYGWPPAAYPAVTAPYEASPRFPETLLPALLNNQVSGLPTAIKWHLVLAYAGNAVMPRSMRHQFRLAALGEAQVALNQAAMFPHRTSRAWWWDDTYADVRNETGILLDVLGHLGPDVLSLELLRRAEDLPDPRLRLFAAVSLARLGHDPSATAVEAIAAEAETRNLWVDMVSSLGRRDLLSERQLSQEKLAESNMVQWLIFPTELGRAPDHIELMKTIERDLGADAGVFVYFVFRFKTDSPHWSAKNGWMAGISGPFKRSEFPTTQDWGDTFSAFTKWDEFSADEHLASVEELMQRWRESHDNQ